MVCPVHQVGGRYYAQGIDIAEAVVQQVAVFIILIIICRHVHIDPAVIFHCIGVCTEFLRENRVAVAKLLGNRLGVQIFHFHGSHTSCHVILGRAVVNLDIVCFYFLCLVFGHVFFDFQLDCSK